MKGKFRTTFADGSTVENEAENAGEAKAAAKNARYNEVDPSRKMNGADRERHPRIKVAKVEEIVAPPAGASRDSLALEAGRGSGDQGSRSGRSGDNW